MDHDTPKHEPDARLVVVSFALLAVAIASLTLLLDSRSADQAPAAHDPRSPRGDLISTVTRAIPAARASAPDKAAARVVVDEAWSADESSRGSRPDAAH